MTAEALFRIADDARLFGNVDRQRAMRKSLFRRAKHGAAVGIATSGDYTGAHLQRGADRDDLRLWHEAHVRIP